MTAILIIFGFVFTTNTTINQLQTVDAIHKAAIHDAKVDNHE